MTFWSGEKLRRELPGLVTDFEPKRVDCASYQLRVGEEAFVTADDLATRGPADALVSRLGPQHTIRIAPGQFAFLLTEESVEVPPTAMAFISMRATYKFKGLVNVSGFNVDPGWRGKLLFSVYNGGPAEVILSRGDPIFLIVYADLDMPTRELYRGKSYDQKSIKVDLLQNMTAQVFSPQVLQKKLDRVDEKIGRIELNTGIAAGVAAGLAAITAIVVASVALLPSWTGVVIARTLDAANYEMKQKQDKDQPEKREKVEQSTPPTPASTPKK